MRTNKYRMLKALRRFPKLFDLFMSNMVWDEDMDMTLFGFYVYYQRKYLRYPTRDVVGFCMSNTEYDILRKYDWQKYYDITCSLTELSVPVTPKLRGFDTKFVKSFALLSILRDSMNIVIKEAIEKKKLCAEIVLDMSKNGCKIRKHSNKFTVEDKDGLVNVEFDGDFDCVQSIWLDHSQIRNGGDAVVAGFRLADILITFNSNKEKYDNNKRAKEVSTEESRNESTAA